MLPAWSKTMARELVVPWSRARMAFTDGSSCEGCDVRTGAGAIRAPRGKAYCAAVGWGKRGADSANGGDYALRSMKIGLPVSCVMLSIIGRVARSADDWPQFRGPT